MRDLVNQIDTLFISGIIAVAVIGIVTEVSLLTTYLRTQFQVTLKKTLPRSPLHFIPTLLTALGILGTFTGIFLGLQGINLEAASSTDTLLNSSTELLKGMRTAFTTSLWGLGSASVLIGLLAISDGIKRGHRHRLLKQFASRPTRDPILALQSVAEKMEGLKTLNAEDIGQQVAVAITPIFNEICEDVASQRNAIETQRRELLHVFVQELRTEVIEPVLMRLDESAAMTKQASEATLAFRNELSEISHSLSSSIQTIQTFQAETLEQLQEFAKNLQQILQQFQTETQGVMQQVATDIQGAVNYSIEGMEAQRHAFAASAEQASITFREIREDLQAALATQAEQQKTMLQEVQGATKVILQQANKAFIEQSNTLTTVGNEAAKIIQQASKNLSQTLVNIDEMLQNTRQTVQEELEKFRVNYQAALNSFFQQQNEQLESTLGEQREGLKQVVQDLQQVFIEDTKAMSQQIAQSMDKITHTAEVVDHLANTTGLTSGERLAQLKELARTLGDEAQQIRETYQNMVNQFNQALSSWNEQIIIYFEQANEAYSRGREESDRAAVKVCSQLNETSLGLMSVAEYLVAAANDIREANGRNY